MSARTRELCLADATEQAAALDRGEVTCLALTQAVLERIGHTHTRLNAFLHLDEAGALQAAQASDARRRAGTALGPLEGLTLAVKDNIDVAGMPTTAGMATRRGHVAPQDAWCVQQLRSEGMVVLGKLNMHEAALGATNDNPHHGRCEHPLRAGYTPGGSSGGSACAVAAGLCALALGTDTMGSVRIPAAYCGVTGFKAGYGLVSTRGTVACCHALDHVGTLARSLRDLRQVMPRLIAFDAQCADARQVWPRPALLRPRWLAAADPNAMGWQREVVDAYGQALSRLRARGDEVVPVDLGGYDFGRARRAGLLLAEADLLVEHAQDWDARRELFSPELTSLLSWGERQGAAACAAANRTVAAARVEVQRWWRMGDVMLLPTAPQTAFAFGSPAPVNQADLTSIANMAGVPAISLPLPVAPGALPIGLQAIAPEGHEDTLLNLPLSGVCRE